MTDNIQERFSGLAVAGENIDAGSSVVLALNSNVVFSAGNVSGKYIGDAVERIREGLRVQIQNDEVREDDA